MPKILIAFHSRTGHTATVAEAIAAGAEAVRFSEVDVRRIDDLAPEHVIASNASWAEARQRLAARYRPLPPVEELVGYDAIVLGSPARSGGVSAEVGAVLDQLRAPWRHGALANTVASAFTAPRSSAGGEETTLWSILTPLARLGLIIVPPGAPAGSAAGDESLPEPALDAARRQGRRIAQVTGWVTHGLGHEGGHDHGHGPGHEHEHGHEHGHSHHHH